MTHGGFGERPGETDQRHRAQGRVNQGEPLGCKQVGVDQAYDTYLDPTSGRITLAEWVTIGEPGASSTGHRAERTPTTAQQINRIVDRIGRRNHQILVITAAYTGMRWGELAGLAKSDTHLGDGLIKIDADKGALHEVGGQLYLGPPKSAAAVRDIHLPSLLIDLLREVVDSPDHDIIFCGTPRRVPPAPQRVATGLAARR